MVVELDELVGVQVVDELVVVEVVAVAAVVVAQQLLDQVGNYLLHRPQLQEKNTMP